MTIAAGAAVSCIMALAQPVRAEQPVAFTVLRDGTPIGMHRVTFTRSGAYIIAQVEINLRVRVIGITVYRYLHTSREVWRGDRLQALDAQTDDNGIRTNVTAQSAPEGVIVDGPAGRFMAPADVIPTSYWRRDAVQRGQLLDTQRGRLAAISSSGPTTETNTFAGRSHQIRYWTLSGDLDLTIGYTDDGTWSGMRFRYRGSNFVHLPAEGHRLLAAQ